MNDFTCFQLVKARKEHVCECRNYRFAGLDETYADSRPSFESRRCVIKRGELYEVQSGFFEGHAFRLKLCLFHAAVCQAIIHNRKNFTCRDGVQFDELKDYIEIPELEDWRKWLPLIRREYRRMTVSVKPAKPATVINLSARIKDRDAKAETELEKRVIERWTGKE